MRIIILLFLGSFELWEESVSIHRTLVSYPDSHNPSGYNTTCTAIVSSLAIFIFLSSLSVHRLRYRLQGGGSVRNFWRNVANWRYVEKRTGLSLRPIFSFCSMQNCKWLRTGAGKAWERGYAFPTSICLWYANERWEMGIPLRIQIHVNWILYKYCSHNRH